MIRTILLALALAAGVSGAAQAQTAVQAIPTCGAASVPLGAGGRFFVDQNGYLCTSPGGSVTTNGALQPPTATTGKITQTSVALTANTSTQLVAANANRIVVEIQCDGGGNVGIDRTGGTLTSATAAPLVIPAGNYPLYVMPIATQTAITGYTGTAQSCRVTEYLR